MARTSEETEPRFESFDHTITIRVGESTVADPPEVGPDRRYLIEAIGAWVSGPAGQEVGLIWESGERAVPIVLTRQLTTSGANPLSMFAAWQTMPTSLHAIVMATGQPYQGPAFSGRPRFTFTRSGTTGTTTVKITAWMWSIPRAPARGRPRARPRPVVRGSSATRSRR